MSELIDNDAQRRKDLLKHLILQLHAGAAPAQLANDPARHAELVPAIATATEELELHFAVHLRREEEVIFPAVRRFLDRSMPIRLERRPPLVNRQQSSNRTARGSGAARGSAARPGGR